MATRRPASSRARVNNVTNSILPPQQPQRPKSVLSRPTTQRIGDALQDSTSTVASTRPQKSQDNSETNIQVILRCRGRSEREMEANSPVIVQIESAKSKELTIETTAPVSSLGILTLPPTRTYPFDLVFGPEATQSMIYHDVVGPMLSEVLMGYNCTLFAYGQTGTGKTYTMQGDLTPTPMGNPSAHAGIIPRVLFRLFHELEKNHTDYIVKVSFIELYNEELRDLLAPDLSAPTNLTQPMGKDAKASEEKLKIFDDTNKRGVLIQGLEEVAVKDSKDALALLTKGSERRQIAATRFNDHSSRSHSVFSITVHIKDSNSMGDELLRVGKLNLVDLAGSENIGRSGAENKRAREAGMINQSLLTLGRVINALVDRAQHVPYRESKLTRLLQDSLGGRTKTCIIATISPARSNLEETLSTLDYALRAKSIRNKPEVNQRMTRNSLLKEYVAEIERLKADLLAAREKNGIYFSEETWYQMNLESELKETKLVEAKKQVEITENQMRNVRDEYDQSIALLKRREEELQSTKGRLTETQDTLRQREVELQRVTEAYEEEVVVRQAHQATEVELNGVAIGLKNVASDGLQDVSGLFEKLERKNKTLLSNKQIVSENEKLIRALADSLTKKLTELSQLSKKIRADLQNETTRFRYTQKEAFESHLQQVNDQFDKAQASFQQIKTHESAEDDAIETLKQETEDSRNLLNKEVTSWAAKFTALSSQLCGKFTEETVTQINSLEQSITLLHSLAETISTETHAYLTRDRESLEKLRSFSQATANQQIAHLQQQNRLLAQMLVDERREAEKGKNELIQRISGSLGDFMKKRDESLRASIESLQCSNQEVEELLGKTSERQARLHNDMSSSNHELEQHMQVIDNKQVEEREKIAQNLVKVKEIVGHGVKDIQQIISSSVTTHSTWVYRQIEATQTLTTDAFEDFRRTKRAKIEAVDEVCAHIKGQQSAEQQFLLSTSKQAEKHAHQTLLGIKDQTHAADDYETVTFKNLKSIEDAAANLANKGTRDDVPSGSTPRKRKWQYQDEWSLTRSRAELLGDWKQKKLPAVDAMEVPNDLTTIPDHHEPCLNDADSKLSRATTDSEPENRVPSPETSKAEKVIQQPIEPLADSRKRNNIPTRASRRVR